MRHLFIFLLATLLAFGIGGNTCKAQNSASQARALLDRTAKIVGRAGGISASFSMQHPTNGNISGSIAVKGNKFNARTSQAVVWYNGKTQWTYLKKNDEVNVSTPTLAQQQMMNPYTFVNIYKHGYNMSAKKSGSSSEVHLTAQNKKQGIQEMYITVSNKTAMPSKIKMKHSGKWYTVSIGSISTKNLPNSMFTFNSKDYPSAEVIDLR